MSWIVLFLAVFATYRASILIVSEDGPFYLFTRIRRLAHRTLDTKLAWIYEGLTCFMCVSFWISLLTAVGLRMSGLTDLPLLLVWLGIGGCATVLFKYLYG